MATEKEDGELSDGEIDEEVERETAEMGNADKLPEPAIPRPHSAPATAPSVYNYRESRENVANNSDFGSSDSNSDSDSDNDRSWKRQKTMPGMIAPVHSTAVSKPTAMSSRIQQPMNADRRPPAMDQGSLGASKNSRSNKRKNNVWGEVITEQSAERMEKQMTEFDMDTETDRDVESYNYRLAVEEAPRHKLGMSAGRMEMEGDAVCVRDLKTGLGEDDADKWLVDKAETDDVKEHRDIKDRLGYKNVKDRLGLDAEIQEAKDKEMEQKKRREYKFGTRKSAKKRLGQRNAGTKESFKMKPITFGVNEHPKEVAGNIAYSLDEPKRNLIMQVVDVLGVEKAKELWQQTWAVEESGGMMIMNGGRQRSPGGVFIRLMKTDDDVTKQQIDEIFADERKKDNKREKEHRKRKRKQINFERYLQETKEIIAEKKERDKDGDMDKDMELEKEEGQLDLMEADSMTTETHSKEQDTEGANVATDKSVSMESGDSSAMSL